MMRARPVSSRRLNRIDGDFLLMRSLLVVVAWHDIADLPDLRARSGACWRTRARTRHVVLLVEVSKYYYYYYYDSLSHTAKR